MTLYRHQRRSKLEINIDIIRALARHGPLKLTHIMYKANVNCSILKQFINSLTKQNLIEETVTQKRKTQKTTYSVTERGRTVLKHFNKITVALQTTEELQRPHVFL